MKQVRWGILGTGMIARAFAADLALVPGAELVAVGSRSMETAVAFAQEFQVARAHASYEALAQDDAVDIIYIATPHNLHMENSLLCLEHGKAILCEKPFAMNRAQSEQVFAKAREKNLFVMEAMWMVFFPVMAKVRELIATGAIGEVRMVAADFGFRVDWNPSGRLLNPELGGGALLDVGIYPLSLAQMVLGTPSRIVSIAYLGETDVDEQAGIVLGYEKGQLAMLYTAVRTKTPTEAIIMGTDGQIKIPAPWFMPTHFTLCRHNQPDELFEMPHPGYGYQFEILAVHEALAAGQIECPQMPWATTLTMQQTMDTIRGQWGLRYPME